MDGYRILNVLAASKLFKANKILTYQTTNSCLRWRNIVSEFARICRFFSLFILTKTPNFMNNEYEVILECEECLMKLLDVSRFV